jgi:proline iminopeptidase
MTPDEFTNQEFFLDVGDGHSLYVHDWGKANAKIPIIYLHGGPGVGSKDRYKQTFDPTLQRVIFFDQRGCGKSEPYGSLEHNTTQDLVEDIEKIIKRLKTKRVIITGGSWGSFLALAFGIAYPQRVSGMVIQGVFTGTADELDWLSNGRFREFFPDAWDRYVATVPESRKDDPSNYHLKQILTGDFESAKASAYAYQNLEGGVIKLDNRPVPEPYETYDPTQIRLEAHYASNNCFVPDNYIKNHANKLKFPVWLVQGRYDMVCRPAAAYHLHKGLPDSKLIWTLNGHLAEHETANILRLALLQVSGDL